MGEPTEIHAAGAQRTGAVRPDGSVAGPDTPGGDRRGGAGRDGAGRTAAARTLRERVGHQRRFPGRPRLWFELLLIGVSYWVYSLVRNAVPEQARTAQRNASRIWGLEHHLGVAVERGFNHAVDSVTWLVTGMNYYYATLHFIVTIAVLVWVFRLHPGRYAAVRTALFTTTGIALVGFYFFPLAPPRLMTGGGFVDTVAVHHTWGSMASGDMAHVSNQYAAMPSMHIGWSLWCGLTIAFLTRHRWLRVLGLLYPLATLTVIVATANHFFMDAVGGAACLGVGFTASRLLYHRWAFRLPQLPHHRHGAGAVLPRPAGEDAEQPKVPAASR
ncbi:phosphatase PAP2 family protein [Streptacidiphilus sp. ASG 303]|uniref:phosphatase PAP2 family protein n=1 Tax=Streptacidiphilus sp. ASG 303 TaxID=2896847 RepID=UPI001E473CE1|nr:phosphatase PAP2 family protein [Streptacidiphilus sp. ASG 303]MCD0485071.1 phosphatase PAP2 family protein [Streptacidiphilus sp. ASG 303]